MLKIEEQQQIHLRARISSASEEVQVLRRKLEQVCDNILCRQCFMPFFLYVCFLETEDNF